MTYIPSNPNGVTTPSNSTPVTLPAQVVGGTARTTPAINYEFFTNTTNGWFDALGYTWMSVTVVGGAGLAGGSLAFEQTNNITSAASSMLNVADTSVVTPITRVNTPNFTVTASTTKQYDSPITMRYVRLRTYAAYSAGSITVTAVFKQAAPKTPIVDTTFLTAFPTGLNGIGNVQINNGTNMYGAVGYPISLSNDYPTATITTTTAATVNLTNNSGTSASFGVTITAIAASATFDLVIQESWDGTYYNDLYHFERITTTGTYVTPNMRLSGNNIRYLMIPASTSPPPSVTLNIRRINKSVAAQQYRQYFDRTLVPNTLGSSTKAYFADGATTLFIAVNASGSSSSPCTLALQGSYDGTSWTTVQSVPTFSSGVQYVSNIGFGAKWVRATVTTASDSSQVINYIYFASMGTS